MLGFEALDGLTAVTERADHELTLSPIPAWSKIRRAIAALSALNSIETSARSGGITAAIRSAL